MLRERVARSALTRTGGFLEGFSHTLQPYVGCRFGCSYCYVRESAVHRFRGGGQEWGAYAYPRKGIAERLSRELNGLRRRSSLGHTAIFMSSSTDPYQGAERSWRLTRSCLEALSHSPPGLLVVQTRSPLVERDFALLAAMQERCLLNLTVETDREDVRRHITPRCSSIHRRLETARRARGAGIPTQITVSPCLPFSDVETFGGLLLDSSERVVVDSYVSGDGSGGKRTGRTGLPDLYAQKGWTGWQSEAAAGELYSWLHQRIGENAGWSREGFTRQARKITGAAGSPDEGRHRTGTVAK